MAEPIEQIVRTIERRRKIADWSVQCVELRSTQHYMVGRSIESRRNVSSVTYPLVIYHDHTDQRGAAVRGSASVTLLPDLSNMAVALDDAALMAASVHNRPYGIPAPASYPQVETVDPRILEDPETLAREVLESLAAAVAGERDLDLSSAEVFLEDRSVTLRNSRGVKARGRGTAVLLDFVLMARDRASEMEAHIAIERRRLDDLDLAGHVRKQALLARDALRTRMPQTRQGPVLLRDEALIGLLGNEEGNGVLSFHTSAAAKYRDLSRLDMGAPITGLTPIVGDELTYTASSLLPFGVHSGSFDHEGLPGYELAVIKDGRLSQRWATQRYADYLNIPPTGIFGNALVPPGATPLEQLADHAPVQVLSFSWMNPDPVTGDFVAEIRLGYERHGQEWRPVRGGSLSGNLFSALADVRFSRETGFFGHYQGPVAALFGDLTLSGE